MKTANEKKKEIYLLLTGLHEYSSGYQLSASKIAKYVGVSRQYVSKTIKEFENNNIIKCINPEEKVKQYEATYYEFDDVYNVKKCEKEAEKTLSTKPRPRREIFLQKARYQTSIVREYTDFFEKQSFSMRGNCAHYTFRAKIFDEFGEWTFQKQGKNSLIIIIPEMPFSREYLHTARVTIFSIVYEALKWFQKKAHLKVDWKELRCIEKPHMQKKALSPKAKRVAAGFSLNIDGKMLDMSSGSADFEQTLLDDDMYDAVNAIETWDMAAYVENEFKRQRSITDEQIEYIGSQIDQVKDNPIIDEDVRKRVEELEKRQKGLLKHVTNMESDLSQIRMMLEEIPSAKHMAEIAEPNKEDKEYDKIMYQ